MESRRDKEREEIYIIIYTSLSDKAYYIQFIKFSTSVLSLIRQTNGMKYNRVLLVIVAIPD